MYILLVEPDRILARMYTKALKSDNHTVTLVQDAQTAIRVSDQRSPDIVVLANDIPRHNGIEFLYEFKSYAEWRAVPVILLVGPLSKDMIESEVLRDQLAVRAILVKTHTSLQELRRVVASLDGLER